MSRRDRAAPKDLLAPYRRKRDFTRTAEPAGEALAQGRGDSFVIQKHAARRLHFDIRLELDGVLKSWAVTRGPSLNPRDKRLAVRTEDHPLDYGAFEGTIPEGAYGAGSVIVWDTGYWVPIGDPHDGLARGNLKFALHGQRLHGAWTLVRMKADRKGAARENWLLIKERDGFSTDEPGETLLARFTASVVSGRGIDDIGASGRVHRPKPLAKRRQGAATGTQRKAEADIKAGAEKPAIIAPQLATLCAAPPDGAGWLHEIKYDGYRILAIKDGQAVRLVSRTGLDWTSRLSGLIPAIAALPCDSAVIDGEAAIADARGRTDFGALQQALADGRDSNAHWGGLAYYVFDLPHLDGRSLRDLPLRERKARLQSLTAGGASGGRLVYSDHVEGRGAAFYAKAVEMGLEGIVSKDAAAPYRPGRSMAWRKVKAEASQEFLILGYSPSTARGRPFASLLIGYHGADGALIHAGRVGSGFSARALHDLARRMAPLRLARRPDIAGLHRGAGTVHIRPELVAAIAFRGWTDGGAVRHAVFKGLREDKAPGGVRKEEAPSMMDKPETKGADLIGGVRLTHPERLLYPDQGVTKRAVADYYLRIAPRMLPHIAGRLISLVRCPRGAETTCFFQRHASPGFPVQFKTLSAAQATGAHEDYLFIEDAAGLVAAAQVGALELHIWGSRVSDIERPDRIVFDLDPDEGLAFPALRKAALEVREMLAGIGLTSFVMATGGKGLHIVAPIAPRHDWEAAKAFTRAVAETLSARHPDRYTANIRKAARKGRVFVDYLRNDRAATAICPYSTRNRPAATIAVPLAWEALPSLKSAHPVVIGNAAAIDRLAARDPWEGYGAVKQTLPIEALLEGRATKRRR